MWSTLGDRSINASAETVDDYYKTQSIGVPGRQQTGPWRSVADVEVATLLLVHWRNHHRLHGYLRGLSPMEYERHRITIGAWSTPTWLRPSQFCRTPVAAVLRSSEST